MSREELKPCPFCEGEAEFERLGDRRQSCIVSCTNCGCRHESGDTDDHNGSSWNGRATPDREMLKRFYYMLRGDAVSDKIKFAVIEKFLTLENQRGQNE